MSQRWASQVKSSQVKSDLIDLTWLDLEKFFKILTWLDLKNRSIDLTWLEESFYWLDLTCDLKIFNLPSSASRNSNNYITITGWEFCSLTQRCPWRRGCGRFWKSHRGSDAVTFFNNPSRRGRLSIAMGISALTLEICYFFTSKHLLFRIILVSVAAFGGENL